MTPNYAASIAFLRLFRPNGFWILTAVFLEPKVIFVDGKKEKIPTETRPFSVTQEAAAIEWLEKMSPIANIYFSVNPTIAPITKKASRDQIKSLDYLHVDIDPRPGESLDSERARAICLLTTDLPQGVPPPSYVIDSGGGAWGFWELEQSLPIDGEPEKYEAAMRFNLQLEILFGADSCHNVDRIARLPGTVNWPNDKKKARGQTPRLATVVSQECHIYSIGRFTPAPLVQPADTGFSANTVKISGNVKRLDSVQELPKEVSPLCKMVIVQGKDPDNPNRWPSRSEPLFWVCCELVRAQCDDDTIYAVITDPGFGISESVLEKGSRAQKYATRQIEKAREEAVSPDLRMLNDKHAVIGDINGKCRIISQTFDETLDRNMLSYQTFEDFHHRYGNKFIEATSGEKVISVPLGKWWTLHQQRRQYEGILFAPGRDVPGYYNLWQGFACDARPGNCEKLLTHIRDNICAGDIPIFHYLMGWMANAVQHPDRQAEVAVVMRGKKGVGKGVFANAFGRLFGRHYFPVTNSEHLIGRFNEHLRDCVVLFADEAFYAGDKQHESLLKTMVTEDILVREAKGVNAGPARNYLHIIMASNSDWVVPAGADERRFLMLDVSPSSIQNLPYFAAIKKEYLQGGKEAFLHRLMNFDLSQFEIRNVPKTEALQEQKRHSFSGEQEWWFSKLEHGEIVEGAGWPQYVFCTHLAHDFTSYMKLWGNSARSNSSKLGRFMSAALPNADQAKTQLYGSHQVVDVDGQVKDVDRPRIYQLPCLEACRDHFVKQFIGGTEYKWLKQGELLRDNSKQLVEEPF